MASQAIFVVRDVHATVDFYRHVLGFPSHWIWGDPPDFGGVQWGDVQVMFSLNPEFSTKAEGHPHFFRVEDVQEFYDRHKSAGAQIISEIENKPWGMREYTVRDINGYHLRFAGAPAYQRPAGATDALPADIEIVRRPATVQEYAALRKAVNWTGDAPWLPRVLERTTFCVLAIDSRAQQVVGIVRVCGDGHYFTIWDVIVRPEYQGKKIGTAMMERALAELRTIADEGAFVGLFTGKPAFYERTGFRTDSGGMHRSL